MTPLRRFAYLALLVAWLGILAGPAAALDLEYPPRPEPRGFFADEADLIPDEVEARMRRDLDALLTDMAIPIVVVTIRAMAEYGADDLRIETYARLLFDHWGIGHEKVIVKGAGWGRSEERSWNKGILVLVSRLDRKARIELGADYRHSKDALCDRIMQDYMVPAFKRGDFPAGIEAGVRALEQMARGEVIEPPPRPLWHYGLALAFVALMAASAASLAKSGASGWAWVFWGIVFSVLGWVLWTILTSPARSSSGGSFGGGSFGGGFSGGGGATGSW